MDKQEETLDVSHEFQERFEKKISNFHYGPIDLRLEFGRKSCVPYNIDISTSMLVVADRVNKVRKHIAESKMNVNGIRAVFSDVFLNDIIQTMHNFERREEGHPGNYLTIAFSGLDFLAERPDLFSFSADQAKQIALVLRGLLDIRDPFFEKGFRSSYYYRFGRIADWLHTVSSETSLVLPAYYCDEAIRKLINNESPEEAEDMLKTEGCRDFVVRNFVLYLNEIFNARKDTARNTAFQYIEAIRDMYEIVGKSPLDFIKKYKEVIGLDGPPLYHAVNAGIIGKSEWVAINSKPFIQMEKFTFSKWLYLAFEKALRNMQINEWDMDENHIDFVEPEEPKWSIRL